MDNYEIVYAVVGDTLWEGYYSCQFCFRLYKKKEDAEAKAIELNEIIAKFPKLKVDKTTNTVISTKEEIDEFHKLKGEYTDLILEEIYKGNETIGDMDYAPSEWSVKEVIVYL
jgi:hypothetical protein